MSLQHSKDTLDEQSTHERTTNTFTRAPVKNYYYEEQWMAQPNDMR